MALFPVFLVLIVEMNHLQSVTTLFSFVTRHFGVFLFDVFLTGAVFAAVLALVRAAWIAAAGVVAVAIKTKSMLWCCVSGIVFYIVLSLI